MLAALVRRELTLVVRDTALEIGLLAYLAAALTSGILFVVQRLGASDVAQGMAGEGAVGGVLAVMWVLCGVLLPWAWWRLARRERRGDLLRWAVRCGADPGQVALAKLLAGHLYLLEAVALAAPLLLLAWATGSTPAGVPILGALELVAFMVLAGTAIIWWNLTARGEMPALGLSYLLLVALALLRHGMAVSVAQGGRILASLLLAALLATLILLKRPSRLGELEAPR